LIEERIGKGGDMMEQKEYLFQLAEERKYQKLMQELDTMHEVDIAEFMDELPFEKEVVVFRMLKKDVSADIFSELSPESQEKIIASITDKELSRMIEELYVDDAVDMLEEMPDYVVKRVLSNAKPETRKIINQFLNYPEDSAGSIMTAEFVSLRRGMTVKQAMERIRQAGLKKEMVYTFYVTDTKHVLGGVVSFRDLLLAKDDDIIEDIMETDVIFCYTNDDQEQVVNLISKYNFLAIPVVDKEQRLVGIVTYDDAIDVIEEETTEDFEKMAAILPSEKPYLKNSVFELSKNRIVWLLVLTVSALISGKVMEANAALIAAIPTLVFYTTFLTGTGGNAGAQTATTIIRGMAINEINPKRDWLRVLWKEIRISMLVGAVLVAVTAIRFMIQYPGDMRFCITVVLTLYITIILAKILGCLFPMLAKLCKVDPAMMASPMISTVIDACALLIYFQIAQRLMF
jgi:magnesium transporter